MDHIRRGHEQICEEIRRGGGAEEYHAEKKYKEAVAVAVAKCADDDDARGDSADRAARAWWRAPDHKRS